MAHITIRDLAKMCNVSVSTASNAYNRPDQLSAALRHRILTKAREVGYAGPAPAARSLRRGKTGSIGVLFPDTLSYAFRDPYAVELLRGVSQTAEDSGHTILLLPGKDAQSEPSLIAVQQANVDGIVSMCPMEHVAVEHARLRNIPVVGTVAEYGGNRWAAVDDQGAGRQLGEHLRELGHHHLGVITEADTVGSRTSFGERIRGLHQTIPGAAMNIAPAEENTVTEGARAAQELLARHPRCTAIVGCSDLLALGALMAVRRAGLEPGSDITVAGFDDIPHRAADAGLTTVAQPIYDKGRWAARLLLDPTCGTRHMTLPTRLMVRWSSGAVRSAGGPE